MSDKDQRSAPTEADYREALYAAQRALVHASKQLRPGCEIVDDALAEVSRVLDIGRTEENEMVAT